MDMSKEFIESAHLPITALPRIYINGRFTTQVHSGVQRFATEMTMAMLALYPGQVTVLTPQSAKRQAFKIKRVGHLNGQLWEQFDLPRFVGDGLLLNFGNTGPIFSRRQIVVIHDAGVYGVPESYSLKFRVWQKFLLRCLTSRRTRLVTVSEFSRRELARELNVDSEMISVIPEGTNHITNIHQNINILAELGLEDGSFVLAVGNLSVHKNLGALSDLAVELDRRGTPLIITGSFGGSVFSGSSVNLLPKSARYIGRVDDETLKALFMSASCFVFPSYYEGFGLPAVEAMACGCPVAAADIPALREICRDAAVYFDPRSPTAITRCVLEVLDDSALAVQLCLAAHEHVSSMTWERAAERLYGIGKTTYVRNYSPGIKPVVIPS
jgi:glycosyltransferase involved in cell wall biosynthesis